MLRDLFNKKNKKPLPIAKSIAINSEEELPESPKADFDVTEEMIEKKILPDIEVAPKMQPKEELLKEITEAKQAIKAAEESLQEKEAELDDESVIVSSEVLDNGTYRYILISTKVLSIGIVEIKNK